MILLLKQVVHIIAPMLKVRIKSGLKLVETDKICSEIKQQRYQMHKQLTITWITTENKSILKTRETTLNCSHSPFS